MERPILFSAPMVRALLDGSKTQTRRVVKHRTPLLWKEPYYPTGKVLTDLPTQPGAFMEFRSRLWDHPAYQGSTASFLIPCPYGQPGDRLWVRETWATHAFLNDVPPAQLTVASVHYAADGQIQTGKGRPSIHMPRKYSRIDLEITGVRVERLQDISEADAVAEGIEKTASGFWSLYGQAAVDGTYSPRASYRALWEQINGAGSWDANPWVWVVEFKRAAA